MSRANWLKATSLMSFACLGVITYAYFVWSLQILTDSSMGLLLLIIYLFFFTMTMWTLIVFLCVDPGVITPELLQKMNL